MWTIDKQGEPVCLAGLRREAKRIESQTERPPTGDDWNPATCAAPIREALHAEQGGLCAYCMGRIKPHGYRSELHRLGGMKIEHWRDRSTHPQRMYDWDNLLGVCGGEYRGASGLVEHCDTSRKAQPLRVNPGTRAPPRPEEAFEFKPTPPSAASTKHSGPNHRGIWIHANDAEATRDIDLLNLNAKHLVGNRYGAIQEMRRTLARRQSKGEASIRDLLRKKLAVATQPGPNGLPPFAPLIAQYIRKKMRAKGMTLA